MVDILQCIKFIKSALHRDISVKYLNGVEFILNQVLGLKDFTKAAFPQLIIQNQGLGHLHSGLHILEIQLCLNRFYFLSLLFGLSKVHIDELNHLVCLGPALLEISRDGMLCNLIHPFRKVRDYFGRKLLLGKLALLEFEQ